MNDKTTRNELLARMDLDDILFLERCEKQLQLFVFDPELDVVGYSVIEFGAEQSNVVGKRDVPLTNDALHKYAKYRVLFIIRR